MPRDLSVLTWNTMGSTWHLIRKTFLSGLSRRVIYGKMKPFLNDDLSDILCLQEALPYLPNGLKSHLQNLGFSSISHADSAKGNSTLIASKFPIIDSGEIMLETPDDFPTKNSVDPSPRTCLWVDCDINGSRLRVYTCQLRIRGMGIQERLMFLERILSHAQQITYPVIVCGDMNTTIPKQGLARSIVRFIHNEPDDSMVVDGTYHALDERYAFHSVAQRFGFRENIDVEKATWALPYTSWELFGLKLDWFLTKGIERTEYSFGPYISDHRPISVVLSIQ